MKKLSKSISLLIVLYIGVSHALNAQVLENISLGQCQDWAEKNYPLTQQYELLEKASEYNISNAAKNYLPQVSINGQASYQSEVTALPIELPNFQVDPVSKDQYKLYADIYQPLLNSAHIKNKQKLIQAGNEVEKSQLGVNIYQLRNRINQIYFGILLIDLQLEQMEFLKDDLSNAQKMAEAAAKNGISTLTNVQLIQAESINVNQKIIQAKSSRTAFLQMLSWLTSKNLSAVTQLETPESKVESENVSRPELSLFEVQKSILTIKNKEIEDRRIPNLGLFLQAGYGRPALNFLSNEFDPYYLGGIRLNWNLSSLYSSKNDKYLLQINALQIQNQKEVFLFNNRLEETQHSSEIEKYQDLIKESQKLIDLRKEIRKTAEVQLRNGIISALEYIQYLNAESKAALDLSKYEVQLLSTYYTLSFIKGN